ncbi:MAG: septum formation initiator family protein [Bacteroidales bacterium]|jgi:cell division protein DivIC|nr:septum formation initiator family protein [Bacteroidales bacterium]
MRHFLHNIWKQIRPYVRNKYILSFLIFTIWISFFDTYHLIDRVRSVNALHELEAERDFFKEEITKYRRQLNELDHNKESLEKFAREQHLMKKENEDVFIILDAE